MEPSCAVATPAGLHRCGSCLARVSFDSTIFCQVPRRSHSSRFPSHGRLVPSSFSATYNVDSEGFTPNSEGFATEKSDPLWAECAMEWSAGTTCATVGRESRQEVRERRPCEHFGQNPFIWGGTPTWLSFGMAAIEEYDRQPDNLTTIQGRAKPRNPRLLVGNCTLQEFTKSLEDKLHLYEENSKPGLLFTVEERHALNRSKPDLDKLSSDKWPLLHTLAVSGDSIYVDRLLKQDVDVNALDKDGYSALQRAVVARKEQMVNQLLRAKADATIRDKGGATLLHYSVQTGSMTLVRTFLSSGVDVNAADKHGWTALHLAVLTGRADIVRLLLINGADKTLANKDGLTALDLCFSLGRAFNSIEVAKALKRFPKEKPPVGGFRVTSRN